MNPPDASCPATHPHGLTLSDRTKLTIPLAALVVLIAAIVSFAVHQSGTDTQVARNTADIVQLKADVQAQRDILTRIDTSVSYIAENIKALRAHDDAQDAREMSKAKQRE